MSFIQKLFSRNNNVKHVDNEELQNLMKENKDLVILDVRSANEYQSGHIPNAKNIDINDLQVQINSIRKYQDKPILLYCASGFRSRNAYNILNKAGFTKLYNLNKGIYSYKGKLNKFTDI